MVDEPIKRAKIAVLIEVVIEKVSQEFGYEATLADVSYNMKVFSNLGLKLKFKGFNDKLAEFIKLFVRTFK